MGEPEGALLKNLMECACLQLSEIEMLQSMFPDQSEFSIDIELLNSLHRYVNGDSDILPSGLEYAVHLTTSKGKVNAHVTLPSYYPSEPPDIYVRSNEMSREDQAKLNTNLRKFLDTLESGDLVVGSVISWLQDYAEEYLANLPELSKSNSRQLLIKDSIFARAWIYSHHIYSKVKRKDIKDLSEEFNLTGFCLPGKPGLVCVEGSSADVKDWWQTVRSWNWQKIVMKRMEEEKDVDFDDKELKKLNRFEGFQELGSNNNIRIKSSGYHVDMGDIFQYLVAHDSGYMFEEYFGVAGKK